MWLGDGDSTTFGPQTIRVSRTGKKLSTELGYFKIYEEHILKEEGSGLPLVLLLTALNTNSGSGPFPPLGRRKIYVLITFRRLRGRKSWKKEERKYSTDHHATWTSCYGM